MSDDKVFIQIGDEQVELLGEAKEEFIADRARIDAERAAILAEINMKKIAVLNKLEKLGLTQEDLQILFL